MKNEAPKGRTGRKEPKSTRGFRPELAGEDGGGPIAEGPAPGTERLAKVLAERGVASRREAEKMIVEGRVEVNGKVPRHPGTPVDPKVDRLKVDGKPLPKEQRKVYYLLNKPKGYIVTRNDPEGRKTMWELLPDLGARVEAVGRLDINTEGALLLTNDGEIANALTHPSREVPKRYLAKVWKTPTDRDIERLSAGVFLDDGKTAPCKARVMKSTESGNTWLEITVTEGRNRLVRRMLTAIGHPVSKLKRISFATVSCRDLEPGSFRELTAEEVARVREVATGVAPAAAGRKGRPRKFGFAKPAEKWLARRLDTRKLEKRSGEGEK